MAWGYIFHCRFPTRLLHKDITFPLTRQGLYEICFGIMNKIMMRKQSGHAAGAVYRCLSDGLAPGSVLPVLMLPVTGRVVRPAA